MTRTEGTPNRTMLAATLLTLIYLFLLTADLQAAAATRRPVDCSGQQRQSMVCRMYRPAARPTPSTTRPPIQPFPRSR